MTKILFTESFAIYGDPCRSKNDLLSKFGIPFQWAKKNWTNILNNVSILID